MKVTATKTDPEFAPFNLTITVETRAEAEAIYAIFNHTRNTDHLSDNGNAVREAIEKVTGSVPNYRRVHTAISWGGAS